ncbi:MAG: hypothetical protein H6Q90_5107 [Deltaproteobacteria bacterium]|nr:hypothetical protein [Deltaproteobacteria bacterium]
MSVPFGVSGAVCEILSPLLGALVATGPTSLGEAGANEFA